MKLRSLATLYWLNENPGAHDVQVPEDVCERKYVPGVYEELKDHGLIVNDDRMAGGLTFAVLPRVVERVEELAGMYRPAAIRRAVLDRIHESPDEGSTEDYLNTIHVIGGEVTPSELLSAVKALSSADLITGIRTAQTGAHLVRPELTPAGETSRHSSNVPVEDNYSTGLGRRQTTNNSVNVYDSTVGALSAGDRNTLTVQQNIPAGTLPSLFSELKTAFHSLDISDADRNRHLGQIEMIEDEFNDEEDEERATKGLGRVLQKLSPTVQQNLGQLVPALATVAAGLLGG